jgi:uncharacterized membrane protein YuzA (DUF378 family)
MWIAIFNSQNDQISWIRIEYSIVGISGIIELGRLELNIIFGMIRLGGLELNI